MITDQFSNFQLTTDNCYPRADPSYPIQDWRHHIGGEIPGIATTASSQLKRVHFHLQRMSTSCLFEVIWLQLPVHASASGQSLLSCRLNLDFAWHKYHPNLDHHKSSIRKVRCFQFWESRISLCIRYWSHHSERGMWFFFLALSRQLVQSRPSLHSNEFVRSCQYRTRWVPPKCICGCKSWFERICGRRWPLDKFGVSNLQFKGRTSYESLKKFLEARCFVQTQITHAFHELGEVLFIRDLRYQNT